MIKALPNLITLLRLILACFLNIYILKNFGRVSVPIVISCIIFFTDFIDGKIARYLRNTSYFGTVFDVIVDLFYILASYSTLIYLQAAPLWFLAIIIIKFMEFVITSFILKKNSAGKSIFVFDFIGRFAVVLFYITPLLIYVSFQLSRQAYLFISGVFIYVATLTAFISTVYRIYICMPTKHFQIGIKQKCNNYAVKEKLSNKEYT
ncbi:CDP-alcohol phosphatidyltransferase family protein [Clostridium sporogenes]|uniref:CDP-alcohol phosphatidyltransferase family protein n=1 Tax=Clostridium sporogenes TaxID=1509 RepID=UPI0029018737|nr:CDP-alcohol phosphatidyltransferase family protein [Clostridium botulinum]